ncbi:unnamed protein product [Amoebophrya sp. A120]|nr:unnamed protein product [Amoebophrya sp. A120]|eukprot:GSA120T00014920001.1
MGCTGSKAAGKGAADEGEAIVPSPSKQSNGGKQEEIVKKLNQNIDARTKMTRNINLAAIKFTKGMRAKEAEWLKSVTKEVISKETEENKPAGEQSDPTAGLAPKLSLVHKLVAHRGFHFSDDRLVRPLENSLEAYETAWTSGITNCECDIAATLDARLVLLHDETVKRIWGRTQSELVSDFRKSKPNLREGDEEDNKPGGEGGEQEAAQRDRESTATAESVSPKSRTSNQHVKQEAQETPLTKLKHAYLARHTALKTESGQLTTLTEVLQCAQGIITIPKKKMVVEIKQEQGPDADVETKRLCDAFFQRLTEKPELYLDHISVIMSFDRPLISETCRRFYEEFWPSVKEKMEGLEIQPPKFLLLRVCNSESVLDEAMVCRLTPETDVPGLQDLRAVSQALKVESEVKLDGLYLEWQDDFLDDKVVQEKLAGLCKSMTVGVWFPGCREYYDRRSTANLLSELGCSFINTDFPKEWLD